MTFIEGLHKKAEIVNETLDQFFVSGGHHYEQHIQDSMRYSLLSGGKRIRPILMLETGKLFGVAPQKLIHFACALEMIHTYSLIHDDLPAMDNDDLRRGKATNHIIYGDAMAILAGDALLNYAYELMVQTALREGDMQYIKAMDLIAAAAGYRGMIGGQVADIMSEDQPGDKETLDFIHKNKTGQLLTAPLMAAGYIANVDESMMDLLASLGESIGLLFQIKDDLLDIESTENELGKPIGSDAKNNKLTYPTLYGVETSKHMLDALATKAYALVEQLPGDTQFMRAFIDFLINRTK